MSNSYSLKNSDFKPVWWARNRHVQTIWPRFFQRRKLLAVQPERLELPDGDFVDLAWGDKPERCKGLSVLFHGLEGSIKSHYANDMMFALQKFGWWPVLMHFRGCSGAMNRLPRAYHSGDTGDALFVLEVLQKRLPKLSKVALGFSLGANMLLKLLGENTNQHFVKGVAAISPPFNLAECAANIGNGFSWFYQYYLLNSLKNKVRDKMNAMDFSRYIPDLSGLDNISNFRQFDEQFTAPLHGFESADDYYQQCSAMPFLAKITTPTLILHAVDDPFMSPKVIPKATELSDNLCCEISQKGGHVGFMQGTPWRPKIWTHQRVGDFFEAFA